MIPCYLGIYILVQDIHILTMALFSDFYIEIYILAQYITMASFSDFRNEVIRHRHSHYGFVSDFKNEVMLIGH